MRGLLALALAAPLLAQSPYPKHNLTFGVGAGLPGADLAAPFKASGGITVGYGYRLHEHLQADIGLDTVFGAGRVREFLLSEFGYLRIRDFQWLVPFGARLVFPLKDGRWQLSGGGGGAYMRYSERLRQISSYYHFECPTCEARSGWGAYGLVSLGYGLDRYNHFRIGVTSKIYRGHTDGGSIGALANGKTLDRWVNTFADFTFSF
jgi:hypothetical protein